MAPAMDLQAALVDEPRRRERPRAGAQHVHRAEEGEDPLLHADDEAEQPAEQGEEAEQGGRGVGKQVQGEAGGGEQAPPSASATRRG